MVELHSGTSGSRDSNGIVRTLSLFPYEVASLSGRLSLCGGKEEYRKLLVPIIRS